MSAALYTGFVIGKRYLVGAAVVVPAALAIGVLSHSAIAAGICVAIPAGVACRSTLARKARAVALAELVGDPRRYHETWEYRRGHGPSARLIGTFCESCGNFVARRSQWVAGIAALPKKTGLPDGVAPASSERTVEHRYCCDCGLPWVARAAGEARGERPEMAAPEPARQADPAAKLGRAAGLLLLAALLVGAVGLLVAHSLAVVVVFVAWIVAVGIAATVARFGGKGARRNPYLLALGLIGVLGFAGHGALDAIQRIETQNSNSSLVGAAPMDDVGIYSYAQDSQALRIDLDARPTRRWWRAQAAMKVEQLEQDAELIGPTTIRVAALREVAALRQLQRAEAAGASAAIAQAERGLVAADTRLARVSSSG